MGSNLRDDIDGQSLEELHQRGDAMVSTFKYVSPSMDIKSKAAVRIVAGELLRANTQVLKKNGGENNLHYHTNAETFWWVLKGTVKFYGPGDVLIGAFGPNEGLVTPRYSRYWFENGGDVDAEILQVAASDMKGLKSGRTDLTVRKESMKDTKIFNEKHEDITSSRVAG